MSMVATAVPDERPRGRGRKLVLGAGLLILLGAFGYLLYGGLDRNIVYFLTTGELLARGATAYDRPVRLGGQVVPGSVQWDAERLDLRFRLTDGRGSDVVVHSKGAPPQMFRDGMGVVVEGQYGRSGVFESSSLMVKHSNEYRAPKQGESPADAYRSLIKERGT
ncbi:MAG TPA: cytochrome c maturation protein CcmE [Gemmatimonadaceae bacterium]|nr:cytochrome c maturation protein CcmE [Gemmatimonadaceae bacterium]